MVTTDPQYGFNAEITVTQSHIDGACNKDNFGVRSENAILNALNDSDLDITDIHIGIYYIQFSQRDPLIAYIFKIGPRLHKWVSDGLFTRKISPVTLAFRGKSVEIEYKEE